MTDNQIVWTGTLFEPTGYGTSTRRYLKELDIRGFDIVAKAKYHSTAGYTPVNKSDLEMLMRMTKVPMQVGTHRLEIIHQTPEHYDFANDGNAYYVGMTTFETDNVPPYFTNNLRAVDEVWTYTEWGKQVFLDHNLNKNIHVIPHGVDVERFNPDVEPLLDLREGGDVFVFGCMAEWVSKKNTYTLLEGYFKAFKASDPVRLVLKTYLPSDRHATSGLVNRVIEGLKLKLGMDKVPEVCLMCDYLDDNDIPAWYTSLDAYILPSHGEGWSLTHSDAMASGLPTVAINWSGVTEYMTHENSFLIDDYKVEPIPQHVTAVETLFTGHKWATCTSDAVASVMGDIFNNRDAAKIVGQRARQDMCDKWTWQQAGQKMAGRIKEIDW